MASSCKRKSLKEQGGKKIPPFFRKEVKGKRRKRKEEGKEDRHRQEGTSKTKK